MNDTLDDHAPDTARPGTDQAPPRPERPPLRRRTDDQVVAGVASGAAAYFGVDPTIVRIGFVALTFLGGVGIPLYVAGWLLVPEQGSEDTVATTVVRDRGAQFWVGVVLLVVGVIALADQGSFLVGELAWPLVLIGVGAALWHSSSRGGTPRTTSTAAQPAAPPHTSTVAADVPPGTAPPPPPPADPDAPAAAGPPPAPKERRGRSVLGRVTVAVALILLGALWLLDQSAVADIAVSQALAAALVTIGLGLLVGTWWGRARGLIVAGVLLLPFVVTSAALHGIEVDLAAGFGDRFYTPGPVSELPAEYQLAAGELHLDLTELELGDDPLDISARVGAGQLEVIVPADAEVEVAASLRIGEIDLFGEVRDTGGALSSTFGSSGERGPIVLDLGVGAGEIIVRSAEEVR